MRNDKKKYRILIIDDSVDNVKILTQLLEEEGYTALQATNGMLGLEIAHKANPALILLDIKMPGIDGYEVCRRLKMSEKLKEITVIFLSGLDSSMDKKKAFGLGGADYIAKPFHSEEVLARVKVQFELLAARTELEQRVADRTTELNEANIILKKEVEQRREAEIALRGEEKLLRTIAENFPNSYLSIIEKDLTVGFTSGQEFTKQGLDPESFVGFTLEEVFGDQVEVVKQNYLETFRGVETSFELFINNQYQLYKTVPLVDENGGINRIMAVVENITERKQSEKAIRLSQERLSLATRAANIGVWDWDICKNELVWDESMYRLYDLNQEDFANAYEAWLHCVHPDDAKRVDADVQSAIRGEKEYAPEFRIILNDGSIRYIQAASQTFRDKDGNALRMIGTNIGITERKKSEEQIIKERENFFKIFAAAPVGLMLLDQETVIVQSNTAVSDITLRNPVDVIGKRAGAGLMCIKSMDDPRGCGFGKDCPNCNLRHGIESVLAERSSIHGAEIELTLLVGGDKQARWLSIGAEPLELDKKRYVVVAIDDITERKQIELELEVQYAIAKAASATADLNEFLQSVHTNIKKVMYAENCFIAFYDEQTEKMSFPLFIDQFDPAPAPRKKRKGLTEYVLRSGKPLLLSSESYNELARRGDVEIIGTMNESWLGVPLLLQSKPIGVLAVQSYETGKMYTEKEKELLSAIGNQVAIAIERKQAEEALLQSKELYLSILHTTMDGFLMFDMTSRILEVNQAYCTMSGYTEKELLSMRIVDLEASMDSETIFEQIQLVVTQNRYRFETLHCRKDGSIFTIEVNAQFIPKEGGRIVVFIHDITDRKNMINELIIAKEKAEESDRLKSAFLANMSHEIRTPMNGILGFAALLKESNLSGAQQNEYIKIIEKSGERMLNIISEIVDISKIESGLMEVYLKATNINEIIEYVYDLLKSSAEDKKLHFSYTASLSSKEATIYTDGEKLYSVLTNLVKNSMKYTDFGMIEFGYNKRGDYLEFFVKDTGIGIPKDRQEAIFKRFIKADISDKMARQGAGLGLSIAKAFVEILGGKIWVESEEGKGSVFYFTLPYNTEPIEKIGIKNILRSMIVDNHINPKVSGLKILIVEDDETSEILLSVMVKEFSKEILKASTGNEAVEMCHNHPDIDLILMDIQIPGLNGYMATHQIRQFNKEIIIIAQTAFAQSGDREKSIKAGCNDYVAKPISKAELLSIIQKHFDK